VNPVTATNYSRLCNFYFDGYTWDSDKIWVLITDADLPDKPDTFANSLEKVANLELPRYLNTEDVRSSSTIKGRRLVVLNTGYVYLLPDEQEGDSTCDFWSEPNDLKWNQLDGYELCDVALPENSPLCLLLKKGDKRALAVVLDDTQAGLWTSQPTSVKRKRLPVRRRLFQEPLPDRRFLWGMATGILLCTLLFALAFNRNWITPIKNSLSNQSLFSPSISKRSVIESCSSKSTWRF
jgi:hypothetical protein